MTKPTPWSTLNMPVKRIGINAFGYGGTNAHAIIESAQSMVPQYYLNRQAKISPCLHAKRPEAVLDGPITSGDEKLESLQHRPDCVSRAQLLLFSAHDEPTLRNIIAEYSTLRCDAADDLSNMAYTLGLRRTKLSWRSFAVARQASFETDVAATSTQIAEMVPEKTVTPAFIFTGTVPFLLSFGLPFLLPSSPFFVVPEDDGS